MERRHFVLPLVFVIFLFILWPISTEAGTSTNNVRVTLIFNDGEKKEAEIFEAASGKEIQIIAVGGTTPETVLCEDIDKIYVSQYAKAADEIAKGAGRGAAAGAGIGMIFGGIGAVPGAIIGFFVNSLRSALTTDYSKDIKSDYCY
jgi:hypothetical protein